MRSDWFRTPPHWVGYWACAVAILLGLGACSGVDPVAPEATHAPNASGHWVGADLGVLLDIHLSEAEDGTVTGTGVLTLDGIEVSVTASGVHRYPNLTLELEAHGFEDFQLLGWVLDSNHVSARLISTSYEFYTHRSTSDPSTNCVLRLITI